MKQSNYVLSCASPPNFENLRDDIGFVLPKDQPSIFSPDRYTPDQQNDLSQAIQMQVNTYQDPQNRASRNNTAEMTSGQYQSVLSQLKPQSSNEIASFNQPQSSQGL